ncbi:helix-turn-helix domain-containing protein [Actinomadura rugatobispora]|uniref:Helix-turn-helix domain-containing protein n=1 Tax=Actinomadura rugatobispora TaxID=1994 RepID=A0ABW0ZQ97_9ACTN|nr:hypothetical protein GCM10010200_035020 [Actinomadura rugatobispora]
METPTRSSALDDEVMACCRSLGTELRSARLRRNISLRELARRTHYSHTYLSKIERGEKVLTLRLAEQCDEVLGPDSELAALVERAQQTRGRWPRPRQLPAGPYRFVGREAELARARAWLRSRRAVDAGVPILAVHGPTGIGKTALVLRWAAEETEQFPDGTLFADLGGGGRRVEPAAVLRGFVTALGVEPHRVPEDVRECAALFRSLLHGSRTLVVLDGAVDDEQVIPLLPGSGGSSVAITSRERLTMVHARFDPLSITLGCLAPGKAAELLHSLVGGAGGVQAEQVGWASPEEIRLAASALPNRPWRPETASPSIPGDASTR